MQEHFHPLVFDDQLVYFLLLLIAFSLGSFISPTAFPLAFPSLGPVPSTNQHQSTSPRVHSIF